VQCSKLGFPTAKDTLSACSPVCQSGRWGQNPVSPAPICPGIAFEWATIMIFASSVRVQGLPEGRRAFGEGDPATKFSP